jgi:hydroxymethylbilane synthase
MQKARPSGKPAKAPAKAPNKAPAKAPAKKKTLPDSPSGLPAKPYRKKFAKAAAAGKRAEPVLVKKRTMGPDPKSKTKSPLAGKTLVLGSRGSLLAVTQSTQVKELLEKAHPGLTVRLEIIKTAGDADQGTPLDAFPALGVFVKEIQNALRAGRIDAAVHSLKDVPEDQPEGLLLAAFPQREDARDVFVSKGFKKGLKFSELPKNARVGTGSPRRILQFRALRPDLQFVPLRGNVDTRIAKMEAGEVDGIVLAAAGLRRLGKEAVITHSFSFSDSIPAIGQAALALECRADDAFAIKVLEALDDPETREAVELERQFMLAVGGGCKVPMAAHAYPYGDSFRFIAVMGDAKTGKFARLERVLDPEYAEEDVDEIAEEMLAACRAKGLPTPRGD